MQKLLSIANKASFACAKSDNAWISATSAKGFDGDSTNSNRVSGRTASCQAFKSVKSTKVTATLNLATYFSNNERIPYADSDALNNLAVIYFIQNKLLEAEEYYKKAIDKDHVTALYNLGVLYEFQNKTLEAEKYFKMAVNKGDINAKEALERIKKLNNMD